MSPDRWQRVKDVFGEVCERPPAERASFLAEACGGDEELRSEVGSLLESYRETGGALDMPAAAAFGPARARVDPLVGRELGSYRIIRQIGRGGMGSVYLAERADDQFRRRVAVKAVNPDLMDSETLRRFHNERQTLAVLDHPNIIKLLDGGTTEEGAPYLVMDYVEGQAIDEYCQSRKLSTTERLRLFRTVCAAVTYAHQNLVVHRDLKPSNILITPDGAPKLLDFGIAKLLESGAWAEAPTLTDLGGRAFTPECAAPEQVAGAPVTTATDVYALGVLLYQLLAGRHPTGEGKRTAAEHLQGILDTEPPPLSAGIAGAGRQGTSLERLKRVYAGDLDNVVAKALKKRPEERYATVEAFADDLRRYLNHEPVTARPDSLRYRVGKFVRRNRVPVALAVLAAGAVVGGFTGTITQAARATAQATRADSAAQAAAHERDFALRQLSRVEAINDLNNFLLSDAAPSGRPFTVGALLAQAESIVQRDRADSGANQAELFIALGQQYWSHDEDAKARRVLERGYTLSRGLGDPSTRAKAACALGSVIAWAGELERGERLVRQGLAELPADDSRFVLDRIYCLMRGSEVARETEEKNLAVTRVEAAKRLIRELRFPAPALELDIEMNLAAAYRLTGRISEAVAASQRAHARLVELGRERTESAGSLYNNWALALYFGGQPLAAESLFRRAIAISQSDTSLRTVSPMLLNNYARTLGQLDRLSEAARYAERAYEKARRAGDEVVVSQSLLVRAELYSRLGDLDQADRVLAEAAYRFRGFPPRHTGIMGLLFRRALIALKRGDLGNAMVAADSGVRLAQTTPGVDHLLPPLLLQRAEVALAMHRYADAQRDAATALDAARVLVHGDAPSANVGNA
jgi:eukaryotic-like serine/threonine-protein kinase